MNVHLSWGSTPPVTPPAALDPADGLQPLVDAIAAAGGGTELYLDEPGTYYADPGNPATPLTIPAAAYDMTLRGVSASAVKIGSPILIQTGRVRLSDLNIDPGQTAYGVKVYNGGSPFIARCVFERLNIGATTQNYLLGPDYGLQLDGAGVLLATGCTFAFNKLDGLLADSTGVEPNTTLKFDMCSFVQNGRHGIHLEGSCSIAEFNGGNSEGNGRNLDPNACELLAVNMNNVICHGMDFESTHSHGQTLNNQVSIQSCRPVEFRGCSWTMTNVGATRAILVQSSDGVHIAGNFIAGYGAVGAIRLDQSCGNCIVHGNTLAGTGGAYPWVEDYSR